MDKIIVTGAAGFIGSHLSRSLAEQGYYVIAIDALLESTYSKEIKQKRFEALQLNPRIECHTRDLTQSTLDDFLIDVKAIINLAAMPGLSTSWTRFPEYLNCNILLVQKLLNSAINKSIRFIHVSTSSVYGKYALGDESAPLNPISPYGVTKLAAENLVKSYGELYDMDYIILRYFSVYGPGQRPEMAYAKFIADLATGKEISIYGDGTQSRTNTYIDDCVAATISALQMGTSNSIYNICGKEQISLIKSLEVIAAELEATPKIRFLEKINGDQVATNGNSTLAAKELDFNPKINIEEGLKRQVVAFKSGSFF